MIHAHFLCQALLTLFVFSTKDGWVTIMYDGIDAVGVNKQVLIKDVTERTGINWYPGKLPAKTVVLLRSQLEWPGAKKDSCFRRLPGEVLPEKLGGVYGPLRKTLTLFLAKIGNTLSYL